MPRAVLAHSARNIAAAFRDQFWPRLARALILCAAEAAANQPLLVVNYLPPSNRPADLNSSGAVDGADLAILLSQWGAGAASPADLTDDGVVNGGDRAVLLGDWG